MTPDLPTMLEALEAEQPQLARLDAYYEGRQPLAFLSPEAKEQLGGRLDRMTSNIGRLAVNALAERLRVVGFRRAGQPAPELWSLWTESDMDQLAPVAHREALALGRSYALVWAAPDGRPRITVESARQVWHAVDPGSRETIAAVKRWETKRTTEAVAYFPDQIIRYRSDTPGAQSGFRVVDSIDNPLGTVPVVAFSNGDRLLDRGVSELRDLLPLLDALTKLLTDLMTASEYFARPRRWATGIELVEDEEGEEQSPFPEGDRLMVSESPDSKFGSLPASDLAAYDAAVEVILSQVSAISALPPHHLGTTTENPSSADAIRASEAGLTARAEARQATFGRSWEHVMRLAHGVATGVDPAGVDVAVQWADPATRSVAQEADAVVKLYAAGLLPATYALARLGYTADEIAEIRTARRAEALDGAGVDIEALLP